MWALCVEWCGVALGRSTYWRLCVEGVGIVCGMAWCGFGQEYVLGVVWTPWNVEDPGRVEWTVARRFSEFHRLYEEVRVFFCGTGARDLGEGVFARVGADSMMLWW